VGVALHGDWSGESGDGKRTVDLREGVAHGFAGPVTSADGCCGNQDEDERNEDDDGSEKNAAACGEIAGFSVLHGLVEIAPGNQGRLGWVWIVGVHALIQSLNGGMCRGVEAMLSAVMLGH